MAAREFREVRKRLSGPEAGPYIGIARGWLGKLKEQMQFQHLEQLWWKNIPIGPGVLCTVGSVFGQDIIDILVAPPAQTEEGVRWSIYMESGQLDLQGIAIFDQKSYLPSKLYQSTVLTVYMTSVKFPETLAISESSHACAQGTAEAQGMESQAARCPAAERVDHFRVCLDEHCEDIGTLGGAKNLCPDMASYKECQARIPASYFQGLMRLAVQSVYGTRRRDYGVFHISENTIMLDWNGQTCGWLWGYTTIVYRTAGYNYWLIHIFDPEYGVYATKLKLSAAGMILRARLKRGCPKGDDDEARRIEAYVLSTATPDPTTTVELSQSASILSWLYQYGSPIIYGWHQNYAGTKARAVVHRYKDGHELGSGVEVLESRTLELSFFGGDGREPVQMAGDVVAGPTEWMWTAPVWVPWEDAQLMVPVWFYTQRGFTLFDFSDAPFYGFYATDDSWNPCTLTWTQGAPNLWYQSLQYGSACDMDQDYCTLQYNRFSGNASSVNVANGAAIDLIYGAELDIYSLNHHWAENIHPSIDTPCNTGWFKTDAVGDGFCGPYPPNLNINGSNCTPVSCPVWWNGESFDHHLEQFADLNGQLVEFPVLIIPFRDTAAIYRVVSSRKSLTGGQLSRYVNHEQLYKIHAYGPRNSYYYHCEPDEDELATMVWEEYPGGWSTAGMHYPFESKNGVAMDTLEIKAMLSTASGDREVFSKRSGAMDITLQGMISLCGGYVLDMVGSDPVDYGGWYEFLFPTLNSPPSDRLFICRESGAGHGLQATAKPWDGDADWRKWQHVEGYTVGGPGNDGYFTLGSFVGHD